MVSPPRFGYLFSVGGTGNGRPEPRRAGQRRRTAPLLCGGLLLSLASPSKSAEPPRPAVDVVYVEAASCPDRARFDALIEEQGGLPLASDRTPFSTVRVTLETTTRGAKARLEATTREGERSERRVEAKDCEEAARALALVWSLVHARSERAPKSDPIEPAPEIDPTPTLPPKPGSEEGTDPSGAAPRRRERALWWEARLLGGGIYGAVPGLLPTAELGGGLGFSRVGLFEPLLRARLLGSLATTATRSGESARFQLAAARLELCGLVIDFGDSARLRLCPLAEIPLVFASGENVDVGASVVAPNLALGGALALEIPVSGGFGLELGGSLTAPLFDHRYLVNDVTIHETRAVTPAFFAGFRFDTRAE